jgi:flavin reductase (DIM6/NTAB) family NADH-FMN oxidoreductase RutF
MILNQIDIKNLDKVKRLNLINSVTGFKSANLIGTISKDGKPNLAIFSSVTHLGSDPALLSFNLRPNYENRDTYRNIKETAYFTVNHIHYNIITQAHQTSGKYDLGVNEFTVTGLTEEFLENNRVPFVKESKVKLLCKYVNEYLIKENNCLMLIASIESVILDEDTMREDGFVDLSASQTITVNGIDGYCLPQLVTRLPYVKREKIRPLENLKI